MIVSYRQTGRLLPTDGGFVTEKLSLSRARARTYHNFLNPCHRCRLAKLFDNQWIAGNNEAATVTRMTLLKVNSLCLLSKFSVFTE